MLQLTEVVISYRNQYCVVNDGKIADEENGSFEIGFHKYICLETNYVCNMSFLFLL